MRVSSLVSLITLSLVAGAVPVPQTVVGTDNSTVDSSVDQSTLNGTATSDISSLFTASTLVATSTLSITNDTFPTDTAVLPTDTASLNATATDSDTTILPTDTASLNATITDDPTILPTDTASLNATITDSSLLPTATGDDTGNSTLATASADASTASLAPTALPSGISFDIPVVPSACAALSSTLSLSPPTPVSTAAVGADQTNSTSIVSSSSDNSTVTDSLATATDALASATDSLATATDSLATATDALATATDLRSASVSASATPAPSLNATASASLFNSSISISADNSSQTPLTAYTFTVMSTFSLADLSSVLATATATDGAVLSLPTVAVSGTDASNATLTRRIAQTDLPDIAQSWQDLCLVSGGDIFTNEPCVNLAGVDGINALLADADPCAQQDNADAMIDFAKSANVTNSDALIANALAYRAHPRSALNINGVTPSTPYCQRAPRNAELVGVVNAQLDGVEPGIFGGPTFGLVAFGDASSCPFGTAPDVTTCSCL